MARQLASTAHLKLSWLPPKAPVMVLTELRVSSGAWSSVTTWVKEVPFLRQKDGLIERWSPLHWSYIFFQTKSLVFVLNFLRFRYPRITTNSPIHHGNWKIIQVMVTFLPPTSKTSPTNMAAVPWCRGSPEWWPLHPGQWPATWPFEPPTWEIYGSFPQGVKTKKCMRNHHLEHYLNYMSRSQPHV